MSMNRPKQKPIREINREQNLRACLSAVESIDRRNDIGLRDFVLNRLSMPSRWGPIVAMALLDGRWESAEDPVAYVKTVARRKAKLWQPELVGLRDLDDKASTRRTVWAQDEPSVSWAIRSKRATSKRPTLGFRDDSYETFTDPDNSTLDRKIFR